MNVTLINALPGLPSPDSTTRNGQYAASLASGTNGLERAISGLEPNTAYSFSVWVKAESGESVRIGVSGTGTPDQWTDVGGTGNEFVRRIITFNTGASGTGATLSVTRTSSGSGYVYVDDTGLIPFPEAMAGNEVVNGGFEAGWSGGWFAIGGTLAMTNTASHSGTYSGLVSSRTAAWGSARQAVSLENRKTYRVSAWAKLASGSDTGRIVAKLTIGGTNYYRTLASGTINSAGWSEISGEYTFNETAPITSARIYVDTRLQPPICISTICARSASKRI